MKIVYIGDRLSPQVFYVPYSNPLMLKPLVKWCEYVECHTLEEAREQTVDADVVYLENMLAVAFREELHFLNELPLFVCASYCDIWRRPWWGNSAVRIDAHVGVYRDCAKRCFPWYDSFYWAPMRVHMEDYDVPRDIDMIFWGQWHDHSYNFRRFLVANYVEPWTKDMEPEMVSSGLYLYTIEVNGASYRFARLSQHGDFFGPKFYQLLSRCKIALSGPIHKKGSQCSAGKFFENAAYGAVGISTKFDDSEDLGFEHKRNIWFTNEECFLDDLVYLLDNPSVVEEIAKNGKDLIRARHTEEIRAKELYDFLCEKTGKK